jgi:hypothetical protein
LGAVAEFFGVDPSYDRSMQVRVATAAIVVVLSVVGVATAGGGFQSPNHEATVTLSSVAAGAANIAVTIQLPTVLQCGRPTGGDVAVTLPRTARVPHAIAASAVRVNGVTPSKVTVTGRIVTVGLPVHKGITCFALVDGIMKLTVAPSAALGNPPGAGTYAIGIRQGKTTYVVPITIKG